MRMIRFLILFFLAWCTCGSAAGPPPAKVVITRVKFEQIARDHEFLGTLYYDRVSHVSSEASGLVKQMHVRAGDVVKKDAPLVVLDTETLEKEIEIHQNQLALSKLSIAHLEKNFLRIQALYEKGSASEMTFDDAMFSLEQARLTELSTRQNLEKLYIKNRKSIIRSPFSGVVLEKYVDTGDWVSQGKTLMDIGSSNDLFINVPVSETLVQYLHSGQQVPVTINAYNTSMTGKIEIISPIADPKTKNVFLKIRIPQQNGSRIAQNMSAAVRIPTSRPETLAVIPRDALVKSNGRNHVYVIREGNAVMLPVNIVRYMGVRVGADDKHFTKETKVVIEGNERLRPGQAVEIAGER